MTRINRFTVPLAAATLLALGGCLFAAAGAGAGGGIYFSERGVESLVAAPVDRTLSATQQAFRQLGIRQTKSSAEQAGAVQNREVDGATADREVSVTLKSEGSGTRVQVIVKKSAVTWDKDFARAIVEKIVALSK